MTAAETPDAGGVAPDDGAELARSPSAPVADPPRLFLAASIAGLLWTLGGCAGVPASPALDTSSGTPPDALPAVPRAAVPRDASPAAANDLAPATPDAVPTPGGPDEDIAFDRFGRPPTAPRDAIPGAAHAAVAADLPKAAVGPRAPRFLEPIERLYPSGDVVPEARVDPVDLDALAERLLRRSPLDRHDPLARRSPIDPAAPLHRSNPATPPDPRDRVGRR